MSILNKTTPPAQPADETRRASRVINIANRSTEQMIRSVNQGLDTIWNAPDPAAVLTALGTDAGAAFALNTATIAFLVEQLSGGDYQSDLDEILAKVAAIPAHTIAKNGSVTLK